MVQSSNAIIWRSLALFLIVTSVWGKSEFKDVLFDLDDTLVVEATKDTPVDRLLKTSTGDYELVHGAEYILEYYANQPKRRISIFTLGTDDRTKELLELIKLPDGRKLSQVVFKHLDRTHALQLKEDNASALFEGTYKKDIQSVDPDIDLDEATLWDDRLSNGKAGQERNLVSISKNNLGSPYEFERVVEAQMEKDPERAFKYLDRVMKDRNRLVFGMGVVAEAEEIAAQKKIPFADALKEVQWEGDFNLLKAKSNYSAYVKKGQQYLQKTYPSFRAYIPKILQGKSGCLWFNLLMQ